MVFTLFLACCFAWIQKSTDFYTPNRNTAKLKNFHLHPNYAHRLQHINDISVIQTESMTLSRSAFPICLPSKNFCLHNGQNLHSTGLKFGPRNKAMKIKSLPIPIWPCNDCKVALEFSAEVQYQPEKMICAKNLENDADNFWDSKTQNKSEKNYCVDTDLGAGLVYSENELKKDQEQGQNHTQNQAPDQIPTTIYGISSYTSNCQNPDFDEMPIFYTRVTEYLDFIQETTGIISDDASNAFQGYTPCIDDFDHQNFRLSQISAEEIQQNYEYYYDQVEGEISGFDGETTTESQDVTVISKSAAVSANPETSTFARAFGQTEPFAEFAIQQKFPGAGWHILSFILDIDLVSSLVLHGCWCTKFDPTKMHAQNQGGPHAVDEIDETCRNWANARQCNSLEGGTCRPDDFTSFKGERGLSGVVEVFW